MTFDHTLLLLNHSCDPNAAIVFDGNVASLKSIRDIKEGEQVTVSYIDNTYKRAIRREQLRNQYFFECHCEGCEPPDNNFTGRDSWQCERPDCGALIPEPLLKGEFLCSKCHHRQTTSLDSLRKLEVNALSALETSQSEHQNLASVINDRLLPALKTLTSCPSWPAIRQPAPALRRQVYTLALELGNFEGAFHHVYQLSQPPLLDIHPEPFHPLRTVQVFTTAMLLSLLAAQENSVEYLKKAWELLKVSWMLCKGTHGEESEFAKRIAQKRREVEIDLAMGGEEVRQWMRMNS